MRGSFVDESFLCRLGFHKWQNYGNEVLIFCQAAIFARYEAPEWARYQMFFWDKFPKVVYEGKRCKRCDRVLMRKFVKTSDGTLSCVGWEEPHAEETQKELEQERNRNLRR